MSAPRSPGSASAPAREEPGPRSRQGHSHPRPPPCCWCATARRRPPARPCRAEPRVCTWPTPAGLRPRRPRPASPSWTRSPPCTHRRWSAPGRRPRPSPPGLGLRVKTDRGLLECEFGDWTGRALKDLARLPEWKTVQRYPSGFRFPGGESFAEMQTRITSTLARLAAAHRGETIVAVSHADPIKAALADALGTHLDLFQRIVVSPCSVSVVWYGDGGPVGADRPTPPVTTSPRSGLVMSTSFDFDEPDHFTTGTIGEPGHRVFFLQAAQHGSVATLRLEKQQVGGAGRVPGRHPGRPARRRRHRHRGGRSSSRPSRSGSSARWPWPTRRPTDRILLVAEELIVPVDDGGRGRRRPTAPTSRPRPPTTPRRRLGHGPLPTSPGRRWPAFIGRAAELVASGRPICPLCGRPIDPDGHACPRLN